MRSLGILIPAKLPLLGRHFKDIGVESTLFSTDWFLCLFCTSTPAETAARCDLCVMNDVHVHILSSHINDHPYNSSYNPPSPVVRILDALFSEGAKILYRVSLALLTMMQAQLLGCDNVGRCEMGCVDKMGMD